jgi:hypothetical protein
MFVKRKLCGIDAVHVSGSSVAAFAAIIGMGAGLLSVAPAAAVPVEYKLTTDFINPFPLPSPLPYDILVAIFWDPVIPPLPTGSPELLTIADLFRVAPLADITAYFTSPTVDDYGNRTPIIPPAPNYVISDIQFLNFTPPPPVPLPGALVPFGSVLFGSVLVGGGALLRRRRVSNDKETAAA